MTNLRLPCILVVLTAVCWPAQSQTLVVRNGSPWGGWSTPQMCPEGSYAGSFMIRVEKNQDLADDTALNGIRLECFKDGKSINSFVSSHDGYWGYWRDHAIRYCPSGFTRFMLKVESPGGDDTAVNNIRLSCSGGGDMTGPFVGGDWGDWGSWSNSCNPGTVICGIQTQVEGKQGLGDDTGLNDARFFCCKK